LRTKKPNEATLRRPSCEELKRRLRITELKARIAELEAHDERSGGSSSSSSKSSRMQAG